MNIDLKKIKMSQIWQNDKVIPVTFLKFDVKDKEKISTLKEGMVVKLSGKSKGKGFQGVVKRHGFAGGPRSHGQKDRERAPGSIGPTAPQRTIKGRKMAGHMGQQTITLLKVPIIQINFDDCFLLVKGPVPGYRGSLVQIKI
ncbi:MAG: large ribosomal subunit protein uL3 [Minisyncoccia bacterium]